MEDNLVDLCKDTIQALQMLKLEHLIAEDELKSHMKKKLLFIEYVKQSKIVMKAQFCHSEL